MALVQIESWSVLEASSSSFIPIYTGKRHKKNHERQSCLEQADCNRSNGAVKKDNSIGIFDMIE
jgi:hypothetical protein